MATANVGDQDANMVDVGDRAQAPGDPPDPGRVWVQKVTGSGTGGRMRPELVMADKFVEGKVRLTFPDGEDGEPVITIEQEVLDVMNGLWKNCMVVQVLGRNISIAVLSKKLGAMWKPKGSMHVIDLPRGFFMVKFELEEEYLAALTGGPWRVLGSYLMVEAWDPSFDPRVDDITTTPVWVRLTNIPVNFYHRAILLSIAKGLGRPIKVDLTTLNFERGRFARVCVAVNLRKPLKGTIQVNGERYYVAYEGLSNICPVCGIFGHQAATCSRRRMESPTTGADTNGVIVVNESQQHVTQSNNGALRPTGSQELMRKEVSEQSADGFTMVQGSKRRPTPPAKQVVFSARVSDAETSVAKSGRNLKEISQNQGPVNIAISNSYGSCVIYGCK